MGEDKKMTWLRPLKHGWCHYFRDLLHPFREILFCTLSFSVLMLCKLRLANQNLPSSWKAPNEVWKWKTMADSVSKEERWLCLLSEVVWKTGLSQLKRWNRLWFSGSPNQTFNFSAFANQKCARVPFSVIVFDSSVSLMDSFECATTHLMYILNTGAGL